MTRRHFISLCFFAAAFVVSVLLGSGTAWTQPPRPIGITIGTQAVADWHLHTARTLKLFEKAGLAPTYVKFTAGPPMIAAVQSKSIDIANAGYSPFVAGLSQGVDWVIIGVAVVAPKGEGFVAREDSGINSLADLRGKKIGYVRGSTSHYGLAVALKQQGIREGEVTLLTMAPAQQFAGMLNKDIDASAIWEPWIQKMIHQAKGKVIAMQADIGVFTGVSTYAVRRDWLRENREAARRFVTALLMAQDVLQKDRSVALKAVAEEMGIPEEWSVAIYEEIRPPEIYRWADPRYQYSLVKNSPFHERLAEMAKFLYEEKVIPKPVDVSDAVDSSVISEVLKSYKKPQ